MTGPRSVFWSISRHRTPEPVAAWRTTTPSEGLREQVVGHDLRQPGLDERLAAAVAAGSGHERADRLDAVEAVAELGAGTRAGERVVAETTTSAGGDPERIGSTTAGGRWQDRAFEIARAIEDAETFLRRLTAGVDERGELGGGRDIGAVEDAQRSAIAVGQEAWIDDGPTRWCGCGGERTDHGTVGSRPGSRLPTHEPGGRNRGPETPIEEPIRAARRGPREWMADWCWLRCR